LATIKLTKGARSKTLLIEGELLNRDNSLDLSIERALVYLGDSSLDISFVESERKDLKKLEPKMLSRLSRAMGKDFDTHDKLCEYLLPAKVKPKKTPAKSKKSTLTE
tara:strand:+ start:85 stop:405 length:321 start_codon:yes stop_codon:yes gene_type:complete